MYDPAHPFGVKKHDIPKIHQDLCVGCGWCIVPCIMDCITVQPDGFIKVEEELCIGCRACKVNCYWGAVEMIRPEEQEK